MAYKLEPHIKYQRKFDQRISRLSKKAGIVGTDCFKKFGVPSVTKVFNDHLAECVKNNNKEHRRLQQEARIDTRVNASWRKYHWLWKYKDEITPEEYKVHARDLGNLIYDLPARWTGYRTRDSIKLEQKTDEHFHPRQWAGNVIMSYIYHHNGITKETVRAFFDVFRQVHHTTDQENIKLKPSQEVYAYKGWEEPYNTLCSELVQVVDVGPILKVEHIWDVKLVKV